MAPRGVSPSLERCGAARRLILSVTLCRLVRSYSFDALAELFDRTRTIDARSFQKALDYVVHRFPSKRYPRALEIGVGTGRVARPFVHRGYRVFGVDISPRMLGRLSERQRHRCLPSVDAFLADATALPFRSDSFDIVYWVHVLHLIPKWKNALDEALRTLRPGGVLLGMSTGQGREIPLLFRQYRKIAKRFGYTRPRLGARRSETIFGYLAERGCFIEKIETTWNWEKRVPVGLALDDIQARAYAAIRFTPERIHRKIMTELRHWVRQRWAGKNPRVAVPNEIKLRLAYPRRGARVRKKSLTHAGPTRPRRLRTQKS
jgi:SAM-dependent methyltransferase